MNEEQMTYALEQNPELKRLWGKITFRLGSNSLIKLITDDEKYNLWVTDMDIFRNAMRAHKSVDQMDVEF